MRKTPVEKSIYPWILDDDRAFPYDLDPPIFYDYPAERPHFDADPCAFGPTLAHSWQREEEKRAPVRLPGWKRRKARFAITRREIQKRKPRVIEHNVVFSLNPAEPDPQNLVFSLGASLERRRALSRADRRALLEAAV